MARTYWLSTWLHEISAATGRLRGIERDALLDETGPIEEWADRDDADAPWRFERKDASEVWRILDALAHSDLAVEDGTRWLHSFDYKDSDAWAELGPMVGVADDELVGELRKLGEVARSHGVTVEVHDFVDLCNLHARNGMRLFDVDTHGDAYLFVALPPAGCAAAIERGLLELAPTFERTPLVGRPMARHTPPPITLEALAIVLACLVAVVAIVYAVFALARSGSSLAAIAVVVALVVGFELAKSAAIRRLEPALGTRHPRLMGVLRFITRT